MHDSNTAHHLRHTAEADFAEFNDGNTRARDAYHHETKCLCGALEAHKTYRRDRPPVCDPCRTARDVAAKAVADAKRKAKKGTP